MAPPFEKQNNLHSVYLMSPAVVAIVSARWQRDWPCPKVPTKKLTD
jgi:hypothetical protein